MPNIRRKNNEGFTLVELIMSLAIFALLFIAVLGVVVSSFANLSNSGDHTAAIKEAQFVVEAVRFARDQGAAVPAGLVQQFPAGQVNPQRATLPIQVTTVTYADTNANPLILTVAVQWSAPSGRRLTETLTAAVSN